MMVLDNASHIFQLHSPAGEPDNWVLQITYGTYDGPDKCVFTGEETIRSLSQLLHDNGEVVFADFSQVLVAYQSEMNEYAITLLKGLQAEKWLLTESSLRYKDDDSRRLLVRRCMQWTTESTPDFVDKYVVSD